MFIFLDTETTGTENDDRLCQLAYKTEDGNVENGLFNPGKPISIDAMSVNHITNEMVKDKPKFRKSAIRRKLIELLEDENNILVAHNAGFDVRMLQCESVNPKKIICTLKLAHSLDEDAVIPRYNLQYLRYYFKLNIVATAHDALGDILVLEGLFKRMYTKAKKIYGDDAIDKMIEISKNPLLLKRMPFGKHKGKKFEDIPVDYLQWLSESDIEKDLRYTVMHYLNNNKTITISV